jgi:SpoVK/Ycf46/Vps4 family AAA+-type ATPase
MQEKKTPTFVVATANDITKLPPELMRKGRFDEIFYVLLPNESERRKIFEIHIKKRRPHAEYDRLAGSKEMDELVKNTDGYSGADIEGVVRDAIEKAFVEDAQDVTAKYYSEAKEATQPLSKIKSEKLEEMKKAYKNNNYKNASK